MDLIKQKEEQLALEKRSLALDMACDSLGDTSKGYANWFKHKVQYVHTITNAEWNRVMKEDERGCLFTLKIKGRENIFITAWFKRSHPGKEALCSFQVFDNQTSVLIVNPARFSGIREDHRNAFCDMLSLPIRRDKHLAVWIATLEVFLVKYIELMGEYDLDEFSRLFHLCFT
jgi:hypothetical protein